MVNVGGKPRISRELMRRMNQHVNGVSPGIGVGGGSGLRPQVNNLQVAKRGRRLVSEYKHSSIGRRQSVIRVRPDYGQQSNTSQINRSNPIGGSEASVRPQLGSRGVGEPTFREPPARGYNPYG